MDIIELEEKRLKWSLETFKEATPLGSIAKAREEIKEIEDDVLNDVKNPEEYADAIMCIFDVAGRVGINVRDILQAYSEKLSINIQCKWVKNPDNSYSRIKPKYDPENLQKVIKKASVKWNKIEDVEEWLDEVRGISPVQIASIAFSTGWVYERTASKIKKTSEKPPNR